MLKMRVLSFWQMSIVLLTFLAVGNVSAVAGTFTAFGPQNYVRGTGSPITVTNSFTILNPATQYTLKAFNGGLVNDQTELVSSTVVTVNGVQVLGESNFNQNVQEVDVPVVLQGSNTISVQVRGQPGGTLTIQIVGVDNDPPLITANVSPAPNSAGWNQSDVTVTFTCSDTTSGIASCPAAQTVTGDVASQTVTGTATDNAGNSASASVIVKIDRTPPAITASVSPAPNSAGWNKSDVTVTFICTDATSGILNCPAAQNLTAESASQTISGTATDNAGNSASTSVTVKIDKTPPVVTVASPPNGSNISLSTVAIGLSGSVSDGLSGASGVTCNGSPGAISGSNFTCTVLLTQGPNSISVQATDVAGNPSSSALALNYAPAPQIAITSPANLSITNLSPSTVIGTVSDPGATITVNGIHAPQSGGSFAIPVPLVEGLNVLTAVATNAGGVVSTATVQVTLDTTPPHLTVDSPLDGSTTTATSVTVTGLANDIVIGTVNAQDVQVTVNGLSAQVANRTYAALDVPLAVGKNIIQAIARDHAGNSSSTSIAVTRVLPSQPPAPAIGTAVINQSLAILSGNNQTGTIGAQLAQPLVVALTDPANNPVANQTVVFKVTGNNGSLSAAGGTPSLAVAVTTDMNGQAQALWTLGGRAGAGINTVQASSSLAVGTASFTATGTNANASQIVVDSGNNQTGVLGQPLGFPFVADVVDSGHNRVPNVPVTFTVKQGDGTLNGTATQTVNTDSNGRAIAVLTLGTQIGNDNNMVEANFAGNPGSPAAFTASGRAPGNPANTTVSGVVLDNSNNPIPGVTVRLFQTNQGNTNNLPVQVGTPVQTAANGTFLIQPAPVGFFKLMADGTTVQGPNSYPTLEYDLVTVAGNDNTVGMPIYLPAIDRVNQLCVDETHGGTLTLPQVPGFSLTVLPGSATFPGGSRTGCVSVTPVNGDKVPMAPGFGQQPRFIVSIQPAGTRFDPPAPMTLPNVDGLQPRAVTEMYSYDHDLGMFVAIGTGTVSPDGSVIASNPGVGVLKAGWHCGGDPNSSGSSASLSVSLDQTTVTKAAGIQFKLTASGSPPQDGTYSWEIIATQQGDDPSIAQLVSSPSCNSQPTCVATLQGANGGQATLRVHFKCQTTGKEVTADARIKIVKIKSVKATVSGTPPLADTSLTSTTQIADGSLQFSDATFAAPTTLVLVQNSVASIPITVDVTPAGSDVAFVVKEDPADASGGPVPAITKTGTNTATLSSNGTGSFQVLAFIDENGNGSRDDHEGGAVLALILVSVKPKADRSAGNSANLTAAFDDGAGNPATWAFIQVQAGQFGAGIGAVGVSFDADAVLVGGGADGRRGLDRVFLGWINNFTALNYLGSFPPTSTTSRLQVSNGAAASTTVGGIPVFLAGDPAPVILPYPMLDTGRTATPAGGVEFTFTQSPNDGRGTVTALGVGEMRTVTANDSPSWFYLRKHPSFPAKELRSITHHLESTTRLTAWTNSTGVPGNSTGTANAVGFLTFSVVYEDNWVVNGQYTIAPPAGGGNYTLTTTTATIKDTSTAKNPAVPASSTGLTLKQPTTLNTRALDARN